MDTWLPPIDVIETASHIFVRVGIEAADARDLHIQVDADQLIVYGDTPREFRRSICLIDPVDAQGIEHYVADEVIEVRVPKTLRLAA